MSEQSRLSCIERPVQAFREVNKTFATLRGPGAVFAKYFNFKIRRDHGKISYERPYESVDEKSLPWDMSLNRSTENIIHITKYFIKLFKDYFLMISSFQIM